MTNLISTTQPLTFTVSRDMVYERSEETLETRIDGADAIEATINELIAYAKTSEYACKMTVDFGDSHSASWTTLLDARSAVYRAMVWGERVRFGVEIINYANGNTVTKTVYVSCNQIAAPWAPAFGSFLDLRTPMDNLSQRETEYERGLAVGSKARAFYISQRGAWSTRNEDDSHTNAYEVLGYHAGTAYFYAGVVASGVPVIDFRSKPEGISLY